MTASAVKEFDGSTLPAMMLDQIPVDATVIDPEGKRYFCRTRDFRTAEPYGLLTKNFFHGFY